MLLFVIALIGLGVWMIKQIPMEPIFQTAIQVIAVVVVIILLLRVVAPHIPNVLP
jgi:hypothetical protein